MYVAALQDEMALSALIGVSVPTHFINAGGRGNVGQPAPPGQHIRTGVCVAQVGARFEREGRMAWRHLMVTAKQNTEANGYGAAAAGRDGVLAAWASFYGVPHFPTFEEARRCAAAEPGRYIRIQRGYEEKYLDGLLLRRRMTVVAETFLLNANRCAALQTDRLGHEVRAFCHIVGLGLGVWRVAAEQSQLLVESYAEAAARLRLPHVAEICFAWIRDVDTCGGCRHDEYVP